MLASVVALALSLSGALVEPQQPCFDRTCEESSSRLAQGDRLEEDFGDPPPPPPMDPDDDAAQDAPDAVGDAPPLPPPVVDDTPDAPDGGGEPEPDTERKRGKADGGDSTILTRALQYGAGFGTLAACSVAGGTGICCGIGCLTPALAPFAFTLPLLGTCLSAASYVALGGAAGAAAGAVQGVVGDAFGDEEGGFLWPMIAAGGTGAGLMALIGAASLGSAILSPSFGVTQPGSLSFTNATTCLFSTASLFLCGAFCVGTPLAGVLTYGAVATPKAPEDEGAEVMLPPPSPSLTVLASGMAY